MKNVKKMIDEADDNILDELIAACESKMSSKFKPKEEESEEEPEVEVVAVESDDEDDMDEEKLMKLLEMYKNSKG
jgi:hypothetical protein